MYIAIDGDRIGKSIEYFILSNQLEELKVFSDIMLKNIEDLKENILKMDGKIYMAGGDNILAYIPDKYLDKIIDVVKTLRINNSFSIGYSKKVQGAYLALNYAKTLGINKVIYACNKDEWLFKEVTF